MTAGCAASRRVLARTPVAPLPASSPKRPTGINGRTSAPPEMYLPEVCSFRLPLTARAALFENVRLARGFKPQNGVLRGYPQKRDFGLFLANVYVGLGGVFWRVRDLT